MKSDWRARYRAQRDGMEDLQEYSHSKTGFLFHDNGEFAEFTDIDDDIYVR